MDTVILQRALAQARSIMLLDLHRDRDARPGSTRRRALRLERFDASIFLDVFSVLQLICFFGGHALSVES